MNSRLRRKVAAHEHNERKLLMLDLNVLRSAIYAKHKTSVCVVFDKANDSVRREIERLSGIFESDTPPPRKVGITGGRSSEKMQLAAIAAMAEIGSL